MIVLKILAAPFVVVLTVLAAVVSFLFCMATAVFVVACVVLTLLSVALFISGQNLFTLTNIKVLDPEVLDAAYPLLMTFQTGLSLSF